MPSAKKVKKVVDERGLFPGALEMMVLQSLRRQPMPYGLRQ
jgi:hypothetical protein